MTVLSLIDLYLILYLTDISEIKLFHISGTWKFLNPLPKFYLKKTAHSEEGMSAECRHSSTNAKVHSGLCHGMILLSGDI